MRKLIINVFLFVMPIIVVAAGFEIAIRSIPNNYSYKSNYLNKNAGDIQVLVLGSSHAFAGVEPIYLSYKGFNAAASSQTLEIDLDILKKYDGKWNNLKYIILPVDYFSLSSDLSTSIESWRIKSYEIYYKIKVSGSIRDNLEIASTLELSGQKLKDYFLHKKSWVTCSASGRDSTYNTANDQDLSNTAISAALRHRAVGNQYFAKNINALQAIISLAAKNKTKVILYMSPAYKTYVQRLNSQQLDSVITATKKIKAANANVSYYNFLDDTSFKKNEFFDSDHLNQNGAKKLTLKLDSIIKINR